MALAWALATFVIEAPPGKALGVVCGRPSGVSLRKPWLMLHWGYVGVISWICYMRLCSSYVVVFMAAATQTVSGSTELCYGGHDTSGRE